MTDDLEPFHFVQENLHTSHGFASAADLLALKRELVEYGLYEEETREMLGLGERYDGG